MRWSFSRRSWLQAAGLGSLIGTVGAVRRIAGQSRRSARRPRARPRRSCAWARSARVDTSLFDPDAYLRSFNFSHLPGGSARSVLSRDAASRRLAAARVRDLRRRSRDRDRARREVPGVDLQRPGAGPDDSRHRGRPGPRALRQPGRASAHDAFPRLAPPGDGRLARRPPGAARQATSSTSSTPIPFGLHLYHCHAVPLKRHIHKGLYGTFIIDPKGADQRRATSW